GRPGVEIVDAAIALLRGAGTRQVDAVGQRVAGAAGFEVLAEVGLQAVRALVEVELALAALVAAGRSAADLDGFLDGCAVLAVDLPVQAVGEGEAGGVHLVRERHPRARLVVVGIERKVVRAGQRLQAAAGEHVGIGGLLVAFHGQAEALVGGRGEDQLGQQAAAVAILRVRLRARGAFAADLALVLRFLALAVVDHGHARPAFAADRDGGAGGQRVPAAFRAQAHADVAVLAVGEIVGRILGGECHGAAQCVGAIQRTCRAAHDLGPFERVDVNEVAIGVGIAADGPGVRRRDAVDLDAHAVGVEAADADAADAEAAEARGDADAGFVAEQAGQVVGEQLVHAFAVDRVDGGGDIGRGTAGAWRDYDEALEGGRRTRAR